MSSSHEVIKRTLTGLSASEAPLVKSYLDKQNASGRRLYFDWITVKNTEDGTLVVEAVPSAMSSADIALTAIYESVRCARYVCGR